MPCPDVFVQDVPTLAKRAGIELMDFLDSRHPAQLDEEHSVFLNFEAYFFGDLWNRERFLSDPLRYCGLLTDPVSKRRFRPNEDSPRARHEQRTYYFEDESHKLRFEEDPQAYRLPGWKM